MHVHEIQGMAARAAADKAFAGKDTIVHIYGEPDGVKTYIGRDGKPTTDKALAFPYRYDSDKVSDQLFQIICAGLPPVRVERA